MLNVQQNMAAEEKEIFAKYKDKFPFQVVEFANEIGIKVFGIEQNEEISGAISKQEDEYVIHLNMKHSPKRMRFTLAHELGHYFNDRSYLDSCGTIEDFTKQSHSKWLFRAEKPEQDPTMRKMDVVANRFAAELLMPESKFIEKWQEAKNIQTVADFFDVSIDAVRVRAACVVGEIV